MKRSILSLLIAVCLFIIISCTPSPADTPLPKTMPEKTAVLFSSLAEIWLEAGGSVDITVGESIERGFVPEGRRSWTAVPAKQSTPSSCYP
ncbi:MAG: hypothetical protein J6I45_00160 [Clostridia bacterium]|nr:hypothetical protein [Clostridia bacterium]